MALYLRGCDDSMKNKPLTVSVNDGVLSIEIGVDTLIHSILLSELIDNKDLRIINNEQFAKEVAVELENENHSSGTAIHNCLDLVAGRVLEDGSISVSYDGT